VPDALTVGGVLLRPALHPNPGFSDPAVVQIFISITCGPSATWQ
jgi:hypothetical protein